MSNSSNSENVERFDMRAEGYESSQLYDVFVDWIHRDALSLLPPGFTPNSVLDIGCGTGRLLRRVALRWPNALLFGIDPAEGMVEQGRQLSPTVRFTNGSAESLPLPSSCIDLVVSTISFHHWDDQTEGIREVRRVLKPSGYFVLADIYLPALLREVINHGTPLELASLSAMFNKARLRIMRQKRVLGGFILLTLGQR